MSLTRLSGKSNWLCLTHYENRNDIPNCNRVIGSPQAIRRVCFAVADSPATVVVARVSICFHWPSRNGNIYHASLTSHIIR